MPKVTPVTPKNADSFMFFADFAKELLLTLKSNATVERFVLDRTGNCPIEFEVQITKLGGKKLPRILKK
ncbi:hypothetical protein [Delftia sp. DT-2]|uniref:hypothetical protein n=1 Tax=Delftia sp. DT-2 TaxID=3022772 RepID=UPI00233EB9CC|nr:hypothetical protein [Delftia sp. DT-2]MDC2861680.1 hypothetical protein [Delftia sp. DT-2]